MPRTLALPPRARRAADVPLWVIFALLWMAGVLTGVSYCSALTASQGAGESARLAFGLSLVAFGAGFGSAVYLSARTLRRLRKRKAVYKKVMKERKFLLDSDYCFRHKNDE